MITLKDAFEAGYALCFKEWDDSEAISLRRGEPELTLSSSSFEDWCDQVVVPERDKPKVIPEHLKTYPLEDIAFVRATSKYTIGHDPFKPEPFATGYYCLR